MEVGYVPFASIGISAMIRARRGRCWWLTLVLAAIGSSPGFSSPATTPEDELKSAVILTFLRYSEWPGRAVPDQPLTVGVLGRPGLVAMLRRTLEGKPVNNRTVRVIELKSPFDPQCCQVLFLGSGKASELQQALAGVRSSPVLTIGDSDRFLEYGGAVSLMLVDGHMAFEVNMSALEQSGVAISSKLLRYGQVRGRPPG
ncbi:MAG TPA: YfiR family protein [Candidatus Acidoferrales bacterium]|jgi:hypothetical protein|nr:YfiR family protein [Candidatus Acidoferrales bacterium]